MNNTLKSTSYMQTKTGDMIPVRLHVPSTSYINRRIFHLSPVDAEFLLDRELISEAEAGTDKTNIKWKEYIKYISHNNSVF